MHNTARPGMLADTDAQITILIRWRPPAYSRLRLLAAIVAILLLGGCDVPRDEATMSSKTPDTSAAVPFDPTTILAPPRATIPPPSPHLETPLPDPDRQPADATTVQWEGLRFSLPPAHRWETAAEAVIAEQGATVLAQGRVRYVPTPESHPVEQPDGIGLTIIRFTGTSDEWQAQEAQTPSANPINPNSVHAATVAERAAVAYSRMVTGVSRSERLVVPLAADRLLLIDLSDADNPAYQAWLASLVIEP